MENQKANANVIIYVTVGIAIIVLMITGIWLIVQSNTMYSQSYKQSNLLTEKALDTTFRKPITVATPSYSTIKDGYGQALSFFTLALGALLLIVLLPRLQSITLPGGTSIVLKELQTQVDQLKVQSNEIQEKSVGSGGGRSFSEERLRELTKVKGFTDVSDDPQKGKWGGKSETKGRKITSTVTKSNFQSLYVVEITVTSTNNISLKGLVKFHLHNTFKNPDPIIAVKDGQATLVLEKVYGAFTVGAETEDGIKLELDLAELENAPKEFKER